MWRFGEEPVLHEDETGAGTALASLVSISPGAWLIKDRQRRDLDAHRCRRLSVFQLGIRWLRHMMAIVEPKVLTPYLPYLHRS